MSKKKPGRRPRPPASVRSIRFEIRLTPAEAEKIESYAAAMETTVSDYLRRSALEFGGLTVRKK